MNVTFRQLGRDDVGIFKAIRIEALSEEPDAFASTAEDWLAFSDQEWLRRTVEDPVFVAFEGGDPVGILGLLLQRSSKRRHRATVIMVYVRREHRGSGLADKLLAAATAKAREIGVRQLELVVNAENESAVQFYKKHGFVPIGRIPRASLHEGKSSDELLMARDVQPAT